MTTIRSRKQKSKRLEKEIAEKVKEAFNLSDDDIRTTVGSETGADIKLSNKAKLKVPFKFECKNQEIFTTIYRYYDQACNHEGKEIPLLIIKMNRKEPLAIINFDYLLTLLTKE